MNSGILEQDQVSFDLSNAGSFLQCLLGCISDEDSCQNDVPTELDANLKAWSVSHVLFGEDRAKSFVDAQCSGQYGKSFRLSRSQGLGSPYDPVAETIKLLRRHKDDLAREQAKSSKKNIQKFDIDQVCDRLSSNLGLFNLEWLKERFKESASAFPYEIVEGITGEEVCFLESYLGEGDPFKNCEKVFRQINEVFPNKNTDLAECVEKVRFLSRRKVPLAPVFLLLSQAFLEQRIYHRILEASKQEKKPNLSVKRDLDVVLEHGEWLLDQHVARIGEAADNLLDAIYKLEKDRTDIEPHLEPDDDYPLPGLRKWIEEKKIKDLLDKLIEVAEEEAQWPVNWRQALQQIVGKKKIYGTSVEDGFVLRKKPPRVGEYPNDVYNCFEGVHKWIISHSKKHGAQQLTIDLFQTWGFEKMNRERVDRHFRKKK